MQQLIDLLKAANAQIGRAEYAQALETLEAALAYEPENALKEEIAFQSAVCAYGLGAYETAAGRLEAMLDDMKGRDHVQKQHIYELLRIAYKDGRAYEKLAQLCRSLIPYEEDKKSVVSHLLYACMQSDQWDELAKALDDHPDIDLGAKDLLYKVICFNKLGRISEAFQAAHDYIEKFGDDHEINACLILLYYSVAEGEKGLACYKKAIESQGDPNWRLMVGSRLLAQDQYHGAISDDEFPSIVNDMKQSSARMQVNTSFAGTRKPFRKIRLGYLSADMATHPVGYFLLPVMASTATSHSQIYCYSLMKPSDESNHVTDQFKALADKWECVHNQSDADIERLFLDDGIDIAFDMMCHSTHNRLQLYARRLAPVQISWIGFPVTSGVAAMDYCLTDRVVDPPGSERFYSEKLLYMPNNFLCHILTGNAQAEPPAVMQNGFVTFACFHNLSKVTDQTMRMWARILRQATGARLRIMGLLPKSDEARALLDERFRKSGLPMERVSLAPMCDMAGYFSAYNDVDIMLDTHPFSGATTTFDALRMGRPIITLVGVRHVTRVSYSLLRHVGLADLAAFTEDEYVEKALALANNTERLCEIAAQIPERLTASPLTDQAAFRTHYEKVIRDTWVNHCFENRTQAYDYRADTPPELLEQAVNATLYLERTLNLGEAVDGALAREYESVQRAFYEKLPLVTNDSGYIREYGKLVEMIGRRLDGKGLRAAVAIAKRRLGVFCDGAL